MRKNGTRLWASVVIDAVRNPAGEVVGFAKNTRDVTQVAAIPYVNAENGSIAQMLVDSVVDYAIYFMDLDGIVKSWNPGAQRMKGYSAPEIIGSNFSVFYFQRLLHGRRCPRGRAGMLARDGATERTIGWRARRDGTRLWASVVRAVIEKGPASVIKVPPPEATYLAVGWALPASGHDAGSDGSCRNVALRSSAHVVT